MPAPDELPSSPPRARSWSGRLAALANNVSVFGPVDTGRAVLAHFGLAGGRSPDRFDATHGVDTDGEIPVESSDLAGPAREHAIQYQPVHERVLRHLLARLPGERRRQAFVDLGCGKGRALLMASEQPFARIVGVELSPACCAAARANLARFRPRPGRPVRCHDVEVRCGDVRAVELPPEDLVLFLFHPFRRPVLRVVLERALASLREHPRPLLVAYCNPWEGAGLLDAAGFRRLAETQVISPEWSWALWEGPAPAAAEAASGGGGSRG